jgi:hypothetical protein
MVYVHSISLSWLGYYQLSPFFQKICPFQQIFFFLYDFMNYLYCYHCFSIYEMNHFFFIYNHLI